MLELRDVVKRFGTKEVVRGVSLAVKKGESFGLLGPNGAGKSTTIAMIAGLIAPTEGSIHVGGVNVQADPWAAKTLMGIVPQEIALYPSLSARENLNFFGVMYGLAGKELRRRVDEALETVALTERQNDRVGIFSGGMKRRINIAASLLHRPQLLIMDEPTVGIDPQSRNSILETVKRLKEEKRMTVVYTSHYMEEVQYLCERVAIIDHGHVIADGTLDQVRRLAGPHTAVRLKVGDPDGAAVAAVGRVPGVVRVSQDREQIVAAVEDPTRCLPLLLDALAGTGRQILGVDIQEPNLEAVFLHLTGRTLRD